jgi:hypothetical protein
MVCRGLAYVVAVTCSTGALSSAEAGPRAVVELFTSQGCSSCPAADKLIGQLAADPTIVAISLPIDYWDYLGWKDTLADPHNSARQRGYSKTRGDREVYTPQVVVNGSLHALGSDKDAIEHAIDLSRQNGIAPSLPVTLSAANGHLAVTVGEGSDPRAGAEVWAFGLMKAVTVAIGRGENHGKTVTYHNVARRVAKLGAWTGKAESYSLPLKELGADGGFDMAAIIVQRGTLEKPSAVLGATVAAVK